MFKNSFAAWKPNTYGFGMGNLFSTGQQRFNGAAAAAAAPGGGLFGFLSGASKKNNTAFYGEESRFSIGSIGQWASYLIGIALVILIIMAFVHYFITPVFSLRPGGPGLITIPGFDDGAIYWKKDAVDLSNTVIGNRVMGYTVQFDMYIRDLPGSSIIQPILSRGASVDVSGSTASSTIVQVLPSHNLACALVNGTNDLIVSVMDSTTTSTVITLENIPVHKTVRVGIVVGSKALEVYINGKMTHVKTYGGNGTPMNYVGSIHPPTTLSNTDIRNLHLWPRALLPSELAAAGPALYEPPVKQPMMQGSQSCPP